MTMFQSFLRADIFQMFRHLLVVYLLEIEDLAAGNNGLGNLMELGRGQDKTDIISGFFDRFEEGVERTFTEHVHLIYHVYFLF